MATYCERCGGTLIFDPKIKKISCKLCLHTFDISEIKMIEIGTFEPTVAYLKTDGIELDSDIDYHSDNRCESFFASLNKQGKSSSPFEDDIPDVLPEVNIPLFKPVKGRS